MNIEKLAVTLEHLGNYRIDTLLRPASRDIIVDVENAFKTYFENVPDFGIFSSENMGEIIEEGRNNSYAMTRGAADALTILRKHETEREGERLIREWQFQLTRPRGARLAANSSRPHRSSFNSRAREGRDGADA